MQSQFPEPRQFQVEAHAALRKGFQNGHRCQVLMAPTGGGKTMLAMLLIKGALDKGKRSLFVCDRTTLIDQTSSVADAYGLSNHGVIQADHWRRNDEPFQICSAQTLARRGWPQADIVVIDECFTPDVEILTNEGFIRFDKLNPSNLVAQFDSQSLTISFVTPIRVVIKPWNGTVITLKSQKNCDLTVTPHHMMLFKYPDGSYRRENAKYVRWNSYKHIPVCGHGTGPQTSLNPIERLMIAYQADGSLHNSTVNGLITMTFSFAKKRKIDRFISLIKTCGLEWNEGKPSRNRRRFFVFNAPMSRKLISDHFKLSELSCQKARDIIDEMVEWDGHKKSETSWYYSSVVKENADFFQAVAVLSGYKTNQTVQVDNRKASYSDVHRLFITKNQMEISAQSITKNELEYSGLVYCVEVPTGDIVVRRNGKVLITGNCHTMYSTWTKHIPSISAAVIGLSATPFADGLGDLFSNLVNAATMDRLVREGILVPLRIFSCTPADMKGAETSGGEWTDRAAGERGLKIVGDVVSEWCKLGENRKTICFGATIAHCEELVRQFGEVGVNARLYTSETRPRERAEILQEYRKHDSQIRVLVSVEALAKGFDVPDVSALIDCRPLRKSLSTAMQMWGRGMRCSPATGKKDCLLLDHSGNICRFARDFEDIYFNGLSELKMGQKLDRTIRRDEEDKTDPKGCPRCGHKPFYKHCTQCGYQRPAVSNMETEAGIMREITIGSRKLADDHRHLWEQLCTYARKHSAPEKQSGRAYHLFREIAGVAPPREWRIETTPDVPILHATANKIRSRNIAFIKSRR